MRLRRLPGNSAVFAVKNELHSGQFPNSAQGDSKLKMCGEEFMCNFLNRKWTLINPDTKIHQIMVSETQKHQNSGVFGDISFSNNLQPSLGDGMMGKKNDQQSSFYIVRDDLLHPLVNGNKARKLDGLFPLLEDHCIRDVVTCGGCQSAHAAAVAVSCAERGLKSHLLLRGEQPETLTGYNLVSMLYGNVSYVPRSLYAKRQEMLARHAYLVAGTCGSVLWLKDLLEASNDHTSGEPGMDNMKKVVIVNEGAGDAVGLLGVLRLVHYLSQNHSFGKKQALKVIIDAGTGTTAVGLGLGAMFLGLPWEITAVMLADSVDGYRKHEERLISEFFCHFSFPLKDQILSRVNGGIVRWVERQSPRKFGKVLKGEVEACQHIARQTGVSVDPIYTLAAWELATQLSQQQQEARGGDAKVVMLHTGGTLGMFGLAQRYKLYFQTV